MQTLEAVESVKIFTTIDELDRFVNAVKEMAT